MYEPVGSRISPFYQQRSADSLGTSHSNYTNSLEAHAPLCVIIVTRVALRVDSPHVYRTCPPLSLFLHTNGPRQQQESMASGRLVRRSPLVGELLWLREGAFMC